MGTNQRKFPGPPLNRVTVLLDEMEPVLLFRNDEGEIRFVDHGVATWEPSGHSIRSSRTDSQGFV
jgi:hypothetical protein